MFLNLRYRRDNDGTFLWHYLLRKQLKRRSAKLLIEELILVSKEMITKGRLVKPIDEKNKINLF